MAVASPQTRGWLRTGCIAVGVVALILAVVALVTATIAVKQTRSETREAQEWVDEARESPGARLSLDVAVATLVVSAAPEGTPVRVTGDYDPRFYVLESTGEDRDGSRDYRVRFAPRGSRAFALIRVKLGATPPVVRIDLPRDVRWVIEGEVQGAFAAMELGGTSVESARVNVEGGALALSFLEPLVEPMDKLVLVGDRGSIKVAGLGNASPRSVFLQQHLGELDLDLRGPWRNDSDVRVRGGLSGGSLWLPRDVIVEGLDGRIPSAGAAGDEIARPRLRMDVTIHAGRLAVVD